MIYKIITDFSDFPSWQDEVMKYNSAFYNGVMYISDVRSVDKELKDTIEKCLTKNYFIQEMNDENLIYEPQVAQDWCRTQIAWSQRIDLEKNNQLELQKAMESLNIIEKELFD